ncbi:MAG: 4-hydroxythreonine-4-phosphate dehydrogenase PdxA [Verrucomicrobiota bacterium]|nr:4-hydroxythreonine-4-phosphate dehydrogenase PdxA [Chthoniobacterales bacterium]MDQ3626236.1 4-hydroxythreonine-4-phosphate dehydrogenase PdxA [Verrucomicrobiota bacterium]
MRPQIGITLGDTAGIGPEIVRAALASGRAPDSCDYRIIGEDLGCTPGRPTAETARAAARALEEAADLANRGAIHAVVTGPIHKARMYDIGFAFPGQTEFFADRTGTSDFAMLLTGGGLTVALVTTHIPLREVASLLTADEITRVGQLLLKFLRRRGAGSPRLAVAGLNPHAGESGALGDEERRIIAPAVERLREIVGDAAVIDGPFSPDTIFHHAAAGDWDGVLCMYHDQGLIPLKLHAFHEGVNVTLGLPFPRTSPDHGTAFEIAGKDIARPDSMIAAINLAAELAAKQ